MNHSDYEIAIAPSRRSALHTCNNYSLHKYLVCLTTKPFIFTERVLTAANGDTIDEGCGHRFQSKQPYATVNFRGIIVFLLEQLRYDSEELIVEKYQVRDRFSRTISG